MFFLYFFKFFQYNILKKIKGVSIISFYYVYEITNLINNKKYIGKRKCHCPIEKDNYMGSGLGIKNAINKYGINNFKKEIIYIAKTEDEALDWEEYLIKHHKLTLNKSFYNISNTSRGVSILQNLNKEEYKLHCKKISEGLLKAGIKGPKHWAYGKTFSNEHKRKLSEVFSDGRRKNKYKGENNGFYGKKHSEETKQKLSLIRGDGRLKGENNPMFNKPVSKETRQKRSESMKGKMAGINNPMYNKQHSEETKRKISQSVKNANIDYSKRMKKVICLDNYKIFNSKKEASEFYGFSLDVYYIKNKKPQGKRILGYTLTFQYYEDYLKER